MTSTLVKIDNPYWTAIQKNPEASEFWKRGNERVIGRWVRGADGRIDFNAFHGIERDAAVKVWSWAVTDPEALHYIATILDGRPMVEIGAGNGYWAYMLTQYGVDIVCYDKHPVREAGNHYFEGVTYEWHPIHKGDYRSLVRPENHHRVLFLCWPPYGNDMAYQALRRHHGDMVIFIGEWDGGCTADTDFFELLEDEWEEVGFHEIAVWEGLHDAVYVFERKVKPPRQLP